MRKLVFSVDWLTVLPVLALATMGLIVLIGLNMNGVSIVSQSLIVKHIISIFIGLIIAIIISQIDYRVFATLIQPLFFGISFLLLLVLIFGDRINGAKSWFSIGAFSLQPAEFAKIVVVLIIAHYFSRYHHKINSFISIILSLLPVLIIVFFILLQPDFGTAAILILIWLGMVIFGGIKLKHILILFMIGLVSISSLWIWVFKDYQKQRILTFLDPTTDPLGSGYNILQSMRSVSAGGLMGVKEQIVFVPEVHTDFIFSGFAQQWGLIGTSIYFILILLIIGRILYIGFKIQDSFPRLIILGVILSILIQLMINIGMNIGMLPITGVPLPFMSYGGSSMLVYWILIGLVLSIQKYKLSQGTIFMRDSQDIFG
jgi:rod shape determining protein RodA